MNLPSTFESGEQAIKAAQGLYNAQIDERHALRNVAAEAIVSQGGFTTDIDLFMVACYDVLTESQETEARRIKALFKLLMQNAGKVALYQCYETNDPHIGMLVPPFTGSKAVGRQSMIREAQPDPARGALLMHVEKVPANARVASSVDTWSCDAMFGLLGIRSNGRPYCVDLVHQSGARLQDSIPSITVRDPLLVGIPKILEYDEHKNAGGKFIGSAAAALESYHATPQHVAG